MIRNPHPSQQTPSTKKKNLDSADPMFLHPRVALEELRRARGQYVHELNPIPEYQEEEGLQTEDAPTDETTPSGP